jgi:hypothetical protein
MRLSSPAVQHARFTTVSAPGCQPVDYGAGSRGCMSRGRAVGPGIYACGLRRSSSQREHREARLHLVALLAAGAMKVPIRRRRNYRENLHAGARPTVLRDSRSFGFWFAPPGATDAPLVPMPRLLDDFDASMRFLRGRQAAAGLGQPRSAHGSVVPLLVADASAVRLPLDDRVG